MTIYLDAVWVLNFLLDMMLLLLTQSLAKDRTRKSRVIFGAFIASLIVPITIYLPMSIFTTIFGKILYSILIIVCAFRFKTIYQMIKLLLYFYFISFAIGGGLLAVYFLLQNPVSVSVNGLLTFNKGYGDPISWLFVVTCFPIVLFFTRRRMDKHAVEKIRYDQLCPVTIKLKGKSYSTTAFIDSGNQLVDPLTKLPVIICDEVFLKQWFRQEEWEQLKIAHNELNFDRLPKHWEKWFHIVPYQGVQGTSDFLLALKIEELIIFYHNQKIITTKVLIGIQFANLTKDQTYHCLLQPQILKLAVDSA